jgi:ATP-dependent Lon protease
VLLPADNLKEAQGLPAAILASVQLTAVDRLDQVLARALLQTG